MAKFNDKISTLINNQLPDFVVDEHPQFAQFLKLYFTFMESAQLQVTSIESTDGIPQQINTENNDLSHPLALERLVGKAIHQIFYQHNCL